MAYVMLGRVETIDDMFIVGDFDPGQIRADPEAKIETERLNEIAHRRNSFEQHLIDSSTVLGSLNVRSLRKHFEDVLTDPFLMKCDIFGLSETWLHENEMPEFPNYQGIFVSYVGDLAKGKGLAVFTKEPLDYDILKADDATASGVCVKHQKLNAVFLYLSQNFNWNLVRDFLDKVISPDKPTVIMGDFNWHYPDNHHMKKYLLLRGFTQLIRRATHKDGRIIDQLYTSSHFSGVEIGVKQQSTPYSDHDMITTFVPLTPSE